MLFLNDKPIERGVFPNQETYLKTGLLAGMDQTEGLPRSGNEIKMVFEDNNDLVDLMMLKRYLDDAGYKDTTLYAPYFPYSTMDHTDGTKPLALKYVAELINELNFSLVRSLEPHSMVLNALVNRFHDDYTSVDMLYHAIADIASDNSTSEASGRIFVCFPDDGAQKRYSGMIRETSQYLSGADGMYPFEKEQLCFTKHRDFDTGRITGMNCVSSLPAFSEKDVCVILDDLCRAGRTFTECASILKANGCKTVYLAVTHLEKVCTKNILRPESPVDKIFATNSCLPHGYDDLKIPDITDFDPHNNLYLQFV